MTEVKMRRCTVCLERYALSSANFGITKKGWSYCCSSCKSLYNAIRYRKQRIATPTEVIPMAEVERRAITGALRAARGKVPVAANLLQIARATLYRKLEEYRTAGRPIDLGDDPLAVIKKELSELEERWNSLRARGRVIRRQEARERELNLLCDQAIDEVQRERARADREEGTMERRNRDAVWKAQRREARARAAKLSALAVRADVDQGLAGAVCLPESSRGSALSREA